MTEQATTAGSLNRQRDYFAILEEFFERATGKRPRDFATFDTFDYEIRKNPRVLAEKVASALRFAGETLPAFYQNGLSQDFKNAGEAAGLKFVLGGSSRFEKTHFDSVRKMLLYADTILVPDPVLPWIEAPREEERFRGVLFLKAVFSLLHLKPLIDAQLPYPAILVFPSYERSLETHDPRTQALMDQFLVGVLSSKLGIDFGNVTEIVAFVTQRPDESLKEVENQNLFVGPGCTPNQPLRDQANEYRKFVAEWRSEEEQQRATTYSESELVFQGLLERLSPQYHLLENAEELVANPMLCISSQWHYYSVCATAFEERLRKNGLLEAETIASVRATNQPYLNWLGNIPMEDLVRLRAENQNETFRKRLRDLTGALNQAALEDLNKITNEYPRALQLFSTSTARVSANREKNFRPNTEQSRSGRARPWPPFSYRLWRRSESLGRPQLVSDTRKRRSKNCRRGSKERSLYRVSWPQLRKSIEIV